MNPLTNVRNVKKLSQRELEGHHGKTSWHDEYRDSAWIFIGGMPFDLSEGDVLTVFSQWGEIVNINMVRDKATGKFKGFGFICYENQKSTILAVDNFNGIRILGRTIRVDHVKDYKPPKDSDKLDDITRQLYEQGCAPKAEEANPKAIGGYELLDDEEEERDDGLGTHSVLKGITDSSRSRENSHNTSTMPETHNGRQIQRRVQEEATHITKSESHKDKDQSKSLKRSHKSKKSKKKHSKTKEVKKRKKKHRKHSSSDSSDSDSSDSDTDSSEDSRRKSSSKRDSSPHSKKRRRD